MPVKDKVTQLISWNGESFRWVCDWSELDFDYSLAPFFSHLSPSDPSIPSLPEFMPVVYENSLGVLKTIFLTIFVPGLDVSKNDPQNAYWMSDFDFTMPDLEDQDEGDYTNGDTVSDTDSWSDENHVPGLEVQKNDPQKSYRMSDFDSTKSYLSAQDGSDYTNSDTDYDTDIWSDENHDREIEEEEKRKQEIHGFSRRQTHRKIEAKVDCNETGTWSIKTAHKKIQRENLAEEKRKKREEYHALSRRLILFYGNVYFTNVEPQSNQQREDFLLLVEHDVNEKRIKRNSLRKRVERQRRILSLENEVLTKNRRRIPDEVIAFIIERDKVCQECGREDDLQIDHIIPYSCGGNDSVENIRLLCSTCNAKRGNLSNS